METKHIKKCASYGVLGMLVHNALSGFSRFSEIPEDKKIEVCFNEVRKQAASKEVSK